jgi:hypothetical protein
MVAHRLNASQNFIVPGDLDWTFGVIRPRYHFSESSTLMVDDSSIDTESNRVGAQGVRSLDGKPVSPYAFKKPDEIAANVSDEFADVVPPRVAFGPVSMDSLPKPDGCYTEHWMGLPITIILGPAYSH